MANTSSVQSRPKTAPSRPAARTSAPSRNQAVSRPKTTTLATPPKTRDTVASSQAKAEKKEPQRSAAEQHGLKNGLAANYSAAAPAPAKAEGSAPVSAAAPAKEAAPASAAAPVSEAAPAKEAASAPAADPNLPADMTDKAKRGDRDYYKARVEDFKKRNPGMEPPDYYLDYGDKYASRFTDELSPKLSDKGKEWLTDTRSRLQMAIENKRKEDPKAFAELERNPEKFKEFAYGSHPDAYLDGGQMRKLSPLDLAKIGLTPDAKDLLTSDGVKQVVDAGTRLAGQWAEDAGSYIGEKTKPVVDAVRPAAEYVAEKAQPVVDAAKDGVNYVADKAAPVVNYVADKAVDGAQYVAEKAAPVVDYVAEKAAPVVEAVEDGARYVGGKAADAGAWALDKSMPALEATRKGAQWGVDRLSDGVDAVGAGASWVGDKASSGWEAVKSVWPW